MQRVQLGDRVRLTGPMQDDPDPIRVGDVGTVDWVGATQVGVVWDSGRKLLLLDTDQWEVV